LLLCALALVACGGDDGNGNGGDDPEQGEGPTSGATADAKSDARNVVSHIETCYANEQDYTPCGEPAQLRGAQVSLGTGEGQVEVTTESDSYTVISRAEGGGEFTLERDSTGMTERTCAPPDVPGCNGGSW
jgi:type IV pilus assembly protein PilA